MNKQCSKIYEQAELCTLTNTKTMQTIATRSTRCSSSNSTLCDCVRVQHTHSKEFLVKVLNEGCESVDLASRLESRGRIPVNAHSSIYPSAEINRGCTPRLICYILRLMYLTQYKDCNDCHHYNQKQYPAHAYTGEKGRTRSRQEHEIQANKP